MTKKVTKVSFQRRIERLSWANIEPGTIVGCHQYIGDMLVPHAFQCVGKRDRRDGKLEIVLLKLCFELTVEKAENGVLMGTAVPLKGIFTTGEPTTAEFSAGRILKMGDDELLPRDGGMRFKILENSYHLRTPSGNRIIADQKKP